MKLAEDSLEVGGLLFDEGSDVDARRGARTSECNDMRDFGEGQAEPTRATDEGQ